ncbi:MAG: ABC transporter ATP-binding protein [Thiomargarita sp.]|nr:ABC transporter ATP-binding protein [Thiomargarita sp.]
MNTLVLEKVGIQIDNNWLIRYASLEIQSGQFITFLGANGAGKTTLLRLLAGLWQATAGQVSLNGKILQSFKRRTLAQQISFVPQHSLINFAFTVQEIITMGRNPYLGRFCSESQYDHDCVQYAMEKTDVAHLAKRFINELSGGERQRVMIARSLATQAPIILLDEPTASLDIEHTLEIFALLKSLVAENKTIVLSIHDINTAIRYADQVVLIHQGRIFANGSPEIVLTKPAFAKVFNINAENIFNSNKNKQFFFTKLT